MASHSCTLLPLHPLTIVPLHPLVGGHMGGMVQGQEGTRVRGQEGARTGGHKGRGCKGRRAQEWQGIRAGGYKGGRVQGHEGSRVGGHMGRMAQGQEGARWEVKNYLNWSHTPHTLPPLHPHAFVSSQPCTLPPLCPPALPSSCPCTLLSFQPGLFASKFWAGGGTYEGLFPFCACSQSCFNFLCWQVGGAKIYLNCPCAPHTLMPSCSCTPCPHPYHCALDPLVGGHMGRRMQGYKGGRAQRWWDTRVAGDKGQRCRTGGCKGRRA